MTKILVSKGVCVCVTGLGIVAEQLLNFGGDPSSGRCHGVPGPLRPRVGIKPPNGRCLACMRAYLCVYVCVYVILLCGPSFIDVFEQPVVRRARHHQKFIECARVSVCVFVF